MKLHTFRALHHHNFRVYFVGQCISQTGNWIQAVALSWLVYRMTHSAFMLGLVGFASQIPNFLISPFAGVLADRWNRKRIILITQIFSLLQAAALAWLYFKHQITIEYIVGLSFLLGILNSFDFTFRQSFFIDLVERKQMLGNAIALNSLVVNVARMLGPSIAGFLIGVVGEGVCFILNGVTFLPVLAGLGGIRIRRRRSRRKKHIVKEMKAGIQYALNFMPIRSILLVLSAISMIGMSYTVLMPVFAKLLHGGPKTLGLLMAATGLGSMLATLAMASRKRIVRLGAIIPLSALVFAGALILFAIERVPWHAAAFLALAGFGFVIHMTSCNAVIQHIVDDDMRGRVMSFFTMAYMGTAPLGSLILGLLANRLGAPNMIMIGGAFCAGVTLLFAFQIPRLQRKIRSSA